MKINPELKKIIPPLTPDEKEGLENSLTSEGCRDSIILWNDFIIDGHNRYEICTKHNISFDTINKEFDSIEDVKVWMINNQKSRRNLTDGWKYELAQKKKELLIKKGRENISKAQKERHSGVSLSIIDKDRNHNTQKELSKELGWSTGKTAMADKVWKDATPEIKEKIKSGEETISNAYKTIKGENQKNHYAKVAEKIKSSDQKEQSQVNIESQKIRELNNHDIFLINERHYFIVADSINDIDFIKQNSPVIDCLLTDPPYGINYKSPSGSAMTQRGNYDVIQGDEKAFNPDILFQYSNNVITWGANHYANLLPNSPGWLIWDKREGDAINLNSDCEIAWTNMIKSARLFHHKWNGMIKASEKNNKRIHPTQKPIKLFEWCIEITKSGKTIIDLFSGSGTIVMACENTNKTAIAVEKDLNYAAAALNRFESMNYKIEKL